MNLNLKNFTMRYCMKTHTSIVAVIAAGLFCVSLTARVQSEGLYTADWESLKKQEPAPEWFKDAKFGIYFHWGVYAVPAYGSEWYPRNMHLKDRKEYTHHLETYGSPAEFGYHDFVPMFTAEKFDPDEWADLFEEAGARFAGPVAEHHDGFAMWASELTPWNVKDKGPKRDITGEIAKAIRARGMRLFTSFHHARNNQHQIMRDGKLVWTGHYPRVDGWPTVSNDPELRLLYGNIPRDAFLDFWYGKLKEVIDNYQTDIIWFDSWLDEIPDEYTTKFLAYYFNSADNWGKEVVVTRKQDDLPLEVSILDIEKGRLKDVTEHTWLTDDTISKGSWCYTRDLEIKPTSQVLHSLIDIVSKNGVLVLNISPKSDGTIPENQQAVLREMGRWLAAHGEAIYGTRPWKVYGEGPTDKIIPEGRFGGISDPKDGYTFEDIRYTRSKDGRTLYVIALGWPGAGRVIIPESLEKNSITGTITGVSMIGSDRPVSWKWQNERLALTTPKEKVNDLAVVFKITADSAGFK